MINGADFRRALAVVAHTLNTRTDWLKHPAREQLASAARGIEKVLLEVASDTDELAEACVHLLVALEKRERAAFDAAALREQLNQRRAG